MLAKYFFGGAQVWKLPRVAIHYQEEARVILQAQHEARLHHRDAALKAGAMNVEVIIPEY